MTKGLTAYDVDGAIRTVRGKKIILDSDLARIYGVETKNLNKAFKRNALRFPGDFVFQLTAEEFHEMRFQNGTAWRRNIRHPPFAFTEHGAIMAATVLNSPRAVEMSVFVIRAFVRLREELLTGTVMAQRLAEVERTLLTHDTALRDLYQKLRPLLLPPPDPERKPIGFGVKERRACYRVRGPTKSAQEDA